MCASNKSVSMPLFHATSQKGFPVLGLWVAAGHAKQTAVTEGSWSCLLFAAIADLATHCRLAALKSGLGPRLLALCLPGYQSGSASIFAKRSHND